MASEYIELPPDDSSTVNSNDQTSLVVDQASMNQHMTIDFLNLDQNIEAITKNVAPNTQLWPVIKDDAYGHGAIPIAKRLAAQVHGFCVVRPLEGVILREAGIRQSILVFEPPNERSIAVYKSHNLIASVSHIRHLDLLESGCSYHVNIDTGMKRLGAPIEELPVLTQAIQKRKDIYGKGVYTHFFKADDPGSSTVAEQLDLFQRLQSQFPI